jgi:hypothetical protein
MWLLNLLVVFVLGESSILRSRLSPNLLRRHYFTFRPEFVQLPIRLLSGSERIVAIGPNLTLQQLERQIASAFNYHHVMDRIIIEFDNLKVNPARPYVFDYVLENPGLVGVVRSTVLVDPHQSPFLYHMIETTPRGAFITPRKGTEERPHREGKRETSRPPRGTKKPESSEKKPEKKSKGPNGISKDGTKKKKRS